MKNGVATSLTCTIANGSTTGSDVDPAHAVSLVAGDMVSIRSVATATDPASASARWSTQWESTTAGESICMANYLVLNSADRYWMLQGTTYTGTLTAAQCPMPTNGSFKNMYVNMSIDPGTNPDAYMIALQVNGVNGSNTVTVVADNKTGSNTAVTDAVVAGDLVNFIVSPVDTPSGAPYIQISIVFVSNTSGESLIFGGSNGYSGNNTYNLLSTNFLTWDATEANAYSLIQSCTIRNLYVKLSAAAGAGQYKIISINKDGGAASGLTVNVSGTATVGNDVVNSYVAADGDTVDIKSVHSAGPAAGLVHIGMVAYIAPAASNVYLTTSSSSGGDCTTPAEGTHAYNVSEVVNISATADACYHFVNWTGNTTDIGDVNAISTNISMGSSNKTATANFAINTSVITYSAGANGTINGTSPQTINCGDYTTEVIAEPNACYHFTSWNDANTSATRNDIGTSTNQTFTASFAINVQTVEYTAGAGGSVNGSWPENVNCGSDGSWVLATADPCYHFVDWDDASTTNPRQETNVTSNVSLTANFAKDVFTVEFVAGANGAVNGSWPENVDCGDDSSWVEATADPCYHFVDWDDSSTDNPRQELNVTANVSYTANFDIDVQTIEYIAGANGAVNGSWPENVNCGSDGSWVEATPDVCYEFVNWSDSSTDNPRQDTNVTSNISVTANFAIIEYELTINSTDGGDVKIPTEGTHTYNCASPVSIEAEADTCYHFVNWSGDTATLDGINNSLTVIDMYGNYSITANFAIDLQSVEYIAGAHGSVNGSWPEYINCGNNSSWVLATPDACYHFVNWSDSKTNNPRQDTSVSSNISVTANFAINTYTLTYTAGANGSIVGSSPQTVNCGANGSLVTAVPDACYVFVNWSDAVATAGRTDLNISANLSVTANFEVITYTLSVTPSPVAGGNPYFTGSSPFNCSDDVDIFANTSAGYLFAGWTPTAGINDSTLENASVSMTQNRALTAHYIKWSWIQPPTNLSVDAYSNMCFNMSWDMGINASATMIVICRDTVHPCYEQNMSNIGSDCWILYNGSDTYFNGSCGLDLDLFEYHITAWGTDGASDWSMTCADLTLGGAEMVEVMYWGIAIFVALFFTVVAFWQRQWWLFITAGVIWFIDMAFTFTQYTTADMMYWFGFVYLILAIVCIGCVFWFREKHETINPDVEESQDEKREKRSKKLSALRNLGHKVSGKDY